MARLGYHAQRVESRGLQHNNNNITPPPLAQCYPTHLHALNNNHRLTTAAATAASNAGILSRRRYIHRGSGHNRHRTLHYPKGTNIPSLWTNSRPHVNTTHRTSNLSNLRSPPPAPLSITFALLNTRSLTNKSPVISELILDNNIDFLLLTETWQQPSDYYALNQATPTNYCYIAKPRSSGRGGGHCCSP
ncbi:hypothetical protein SKAU_G00342520 [Synaphobranchus kaupii]|uniref:Endonuclease/exonuclease/phosphatase domain-containing protein n=1 Tax=Synaphobranchus kaupii TaxID=118154 RepID=A0A9Q1ENF7_SYNKA|nr:hypothetical protein SKAU_G00342520 [Synaphobranchus kaupii]